MPIAAFQFDTFQSIASDVGEAAWSDPGNAQESDNAHAEASLSSFGAGVVTEYLVCTGADLSSLPRNILFTKIEVNIEAQGTNSELFEILGCESDGSGGLTLGGLNLLRAAGAGPFDLTGSDTVYPRGRNNWNFWWRERLENPDFGVAIRARLKSGSMSGSVLIDHVELVVHYETFINPFFRKDTRLVMEARVAGLNGREEENEGGEAYQPGISPVGGLDWHDESEAEDYINELLTNRIVHGAERFCLRMPAGRIADQAKIPSAQWEPLFDFQRDALIKIVGGWVRADPQNEVSLYLGGWIKDAGLIDMSGTLDQPDVTDPEHVARLERIYFHYRDFVGVRRFILDNSSIESWSVEQSIALFEWARDHGMEFVFEAIPGTNDGPPDPERLGPYNGYALSGNIENRDPDFTWHFQRGDCTVLIRASDHPVFTPDEWRLYFRTFLRAGYAIQVHDSPIATEPVGYLNIDPFAMEVGPVHEPRRSNHPVAMSVAFPVSRSPRHLHPASRTFHRSHVPLSGGIAMPIAHPIAAPMTGAIG